MRMARPHVEVGRHRQTACLLASKCAPNKQTNKQTNKRPRSPRRLPSHHTTTTITTTTKQSSKSSYPSRAALAHLLADVQTGLRCGWAPTETPEPSVGGSYFVRNALGRLAGVFKPLDEEPYASGNPRGYRPSSAAAASAPPSSHGLSSCHSSHSSSSPGLGLRAGIPPGEAGVREAAAFVLDSGSSLGSSSCCAAGVPPTVLARLRAARFGPLAKPGSLQLYVGHVGSADDFGPSRLHTGDAHRIMLLDLRILNQVGTCDRSMPRCLARHGTRACRGVCVCLFCRPVQSSHRRSRLPPPHHQDRHAGNILVRQGGGGSGGGHHHHHHQLLQPFTLSQEEAEAGEEPLLLPRTPCSGGRPREGALQPFQLPQPGRFALKAPGLPPMPMPTLPTPTPPMPAPESPLALRRTHSFGPALEGATTTTASSSSSSSSPYCSPTSSAGVAWPSSGKPLPRPLSNARASPPPGGGAPLRRQSSIRAPAGPGGSSLRHEASAAGGEEEEEGDDDDEMVVAAAEGAEEKEEGRLRLVPIDHGFALPHPLRIDEAELCWLHWVRTYRHTDIHTPSSIDQYVGREGRPTALYLSPIIICPPISHPSHTQPRNPKPR